MSTCIVCGREFDNIGSDSGIDTCLECQKEALVKTILTLAPGEALMSYQGKTVKVKIPYSAELMEQVEDLGPAESPRMMRWLDNVTMLRQVATGTGGDCLTWRDILVLLDPSHHEHEELYLKVLPYLPDRVRNDFERLRSSREIRRQQEMEAVINRIREKLGPEYFQAD